MVAARGTAASRSYHLLRHLLLVPTALSKCRSEPSLSQCSLCCLWGEPAECCLVLPTAVCVPGGFAAPGSSGASPCPACPRWDRQAVAAFTWPGTGLESLQRARALRQALPGKPRGKLAPIICSPTTMSSVVL